MRIRGPGERRGRLFLSCIFFEFVNSEFDHLSFGRYSTLRAACDTLGAVVAGGRSGGDCCWGPGGGRGILCRLLVNHNLVLA